MQGMLFIFGLLFTLSNAEFKVHLLKKTDGVLTGRWIDSLLLSLPPCLLGSKSVTLEYNRTDTNESKTLANVFTVPLCRSKRDVITDHENTGQFTVTKELGYRVTNLTSGASYRLRFVVGTERSNILEASTRNVQDYNEISESLPARSGAMVVITVILSVAMFILLVALIVTIALSIGGD